MRSVTNTIYISAKSGRKRTGLKELWLFRELLYYFAWRDIKVRYKQTVLGTGWAILQPFLATGVFTLFFNRIAGIQSGSAAIPYAVFAYLGLMYWICFSSSLNSISNSLLSNQGVITKVYFPRVIPLLASSVLSIIDFFAAGVAFVVILFVYKVLPHPAGIIFVLPMLFLTTLFALGLGSFFAALNVKYRDVRAALPFITQLMMFLTPVIYPVSLVPARFQTLMYLNPMAGTITSIRNASFGQPINWVGLLLSFSTTVVVFFFGLLYFKKVEKGFVDII